MIFKGKLFARTIDTCQKTVFGRRMTAYGGFVPTQSYDGGFATLQISCLLICRIVSIYINNVLRVRDFDGPMDAIPSWSLRL